MESRSFSAKSRCKRFPLIERAFHDCRHHVKALSQAEEFTAYVDRRLISICANPAVGDSYSVKEVADFFDYVENYYNRQRRHSSLGYQTRVGFRNQLN